MSAAARKLRILTMVSNAPAASYSDLHAMMRGEHFAEDVLKGARGLLDHDLREITGDTEITLPEFLIMCRQTQRAARLN